MRGKRRDIFADESQKRKSKTRSDDVLRQARESISRDNRIGHTNTSHVKETHVAWRACGEEKGKNDDQDDQGEGESREKERHSPETQRPLGNSVERVSKSSPPSRRRLPRLASDRKSPLCALLG